MTLVPSDDYDFIYVINFFRVTNGGDIRMKLADHTIHVLPVCHGAWVNLSVRRIYETGTTASGFETDLFTPIVSFPGGPQVPYLPVPPVPPTPPVPPIPPVPPSPPPGGYDGNPLTVEVNEDGNRVVFTFGGDVIVANTITISVNGGPPIIWNTSDGSGNPIAYVLPDSTPPIEDDQDITVTYAGGTWTTNPPVGAPNNPVTNGPVINGSSVPGGSSLPVLLSVEVQADGQAILFTWDRPMEILSIDEGQTAITLFINDDDNGHLIFAGGDGTTVSATTAGSQIFIDDNVKITVAAENWQSSDYRVKTIAYTNYVVTNFSEQAAVAKGTNLNNFRAAWSVNSGSMTIAANYVRFNGSEGSVTRMTGGGDGGQSTGVGHVHFGEFVGTFGGMGLFTYANGDLVIDNVPLNLNTLTLESAPGVTVCPVLPDSIQTLRLAFLANLAALPVFSSQLAVLEVESCPLVTTVPALPSNLFQLSVAVCPITALPTLPAGITLLNVFGSALTQPAIDAVLSQLVANGLSNGECQISGGTNATPSAAGLTSKATLESRGWAVTNN